MIKSIYFILLIILVQSCASLTGYQDARALGKGMSELGISANMSQSPDLDGENNGNTFRFPNLELYGKFGITEKLDIGGRLNTNTNVGIYVKYQLIGSKTSPFALGVGGEVGTFGLVGGSLWNAQLPLFTSVHFGKTAFYFSPRYIYQFSALGINDGVSDPVGVNYYGGNTGLIFGDKNKLCLDFGLYLLDGNEQDPVNLITFGLGYKRLIGDNDDSGSDDEMPDGSKQKRKKRKRR